jgi:hypothetical protein
MIIDLELEKQLSDEVRVFAAFLQLHPECWADGKKFTEADFERTEQKFQLWLDGKVA